MSMTREELLAKNREYKRKYFAQLTPEQKQAMVDRHREYKRRKREDPEYRKHEIEMSRARFRRNNTEEYRAKRRAKYAAKHANDPMTEHRRRCIEAANERMKTPLPERRAKKQALLDIQKELENENQNNIQAYTE